MNKPDEFNKTKQEIKVEKKTANVKRVFVTLKKHGVKE